MTDFIGFVNLISGGALIILSLIVSFSSRRNNVRKIFSLSTFFLGSWSLSIFFYTNPVLFDTTVWLKIVYSFAYCMTLGLILFADVFPKDSGGKFKVFFWIMLSYMLIMSYFLWGTDLIVISTLHEPLKSNTFAEMGPFYLLYGIPEFLSAIYVVGHYLKQIKIIKGVEKRQVQFYVVGGILMLIPVLILDFAFPIVLKDTSLYKYSTIGNALWAGIVGYSIFTTRFLDIRFVIGSFLSVLFKGFLVSICLVFIVFFLQPIWHIEFSGNGVLKVFFISVVMSVVLLYGFKKIDEFLKKSLIYSKYDPVDLLKEFANKSSKILDVQVVASNLLNLISKSFKPSFVSVVLFNSAGELITKDERGNLDSDYLNGVYVILDAWRKLNSNRILIYSELKRSKPAGKKIIDEKRARILTLMEKHSIEIIFSLREENKFDGAVIIGPNSDGGSYSVGDIDFIDGVMQSTYLAIVRAMLYLELSSFSEKLKEEVDEKTQELQQKVLELEEARRKERDMIDIMGHELRTPATIVKLNASLLEKYIDSNPENFQKYLDRIKNSIENEIRLIDTLLSSAKLEGQKIDINKERISIPEQIETVLHGYEYQVQAKGLKIISDIDDNTQDVYADKVRVVEVLDNLISNAIKYTDEGSIIVKTECNDDYVKTSVIDSGKGIPSEELPKLGRKFHRIEEYIDENKENPIVKPGGTGLGLYVVFALVELMGGKIWINSQLGKGSTFTFTLPVYSGQREDILQLDERDMFKKFGLKRK